MKRYNLNSAKQIVVPLSNLKPNETSTMKAISSYKIMRMQKCKIKTSGQNNNFAIVFISLHCTFRDTFKEGST